MNQYSKNSRSDRRISGSGYRQKSGRSDFMTVLLFYVLPFLVVNSLIFVLVTAKPRAQVTINDSSDYITTDMELKIQSLLPIKSMELALDGTPVETVKIGPKTYSAKLTNNGMLEVKLTSLNWMKTILYEQVNVLDDTPPTVKDNIIEDGVLSFRLEDTQSGVDYSSIYASDDENPEILPLSIDRSTGLITFELKRDNLSITAKDLIGNELHVTFNPQGENLGETQLEEQAEESTEPEAPQS